MESFGLNEYDVDQLIDDVSRAAFFEECVKSAKAPITTKIIANWIINKKADMSLDPDKFVYKIFDSIKVVDISLEIMSGATAGVIAAFPNAVTDYKAGKEQAKMFLFGNILKELKGNGDKKVIMDLLEEKLKT